MNIEHYTISELQEEGEYRVFPVAWTVDQKESGSVCIAFQLAIRTKWHGKDEGGWAPEWPPGYYTTHRAWVVKKDGNVNQAAVDNLAKCGLWNGDWDSLAGPPPSVNVLASIAGETYQGKTRYRADWLNPDAAEPKPRGGGFSPSDPEVLATLRARFGSKTKAIAGGSATGPAPAPPQQPAVQPPPPQPQAQAQPAPPQATIQPTHNDPGQIPGQISPPSSFVPPPAGPMNDPLDGEQAPF